MPKYQPNLSMNFEAEVPEIHIYDSIVSNAEYQDEMYFCNVSCGCEGKPSGECSCDCETSVELMSPSKFARMLKDHSDAKEILLKLNTNGGNYKVTLQMIDSLKEHSAQITTRVIGLAYSAGSALAIVGDKREIVEHGQIMVHAPRQFLAGMYTGQEMQAEVDSINKATDAMVKLYSSRSKASEQDVKAWLSKDTYFSAEDALKFGLVDTILTGTDHKTQMKSTHPDLQLTHSAPAPTQADNKSPYTTVAGRRRFLAGANNATHETV